MYIQNLEQIFYDDMVTLRGNCVITGEEYSVSVLVEELNNYLMGDLAQDAFPNLNSDDREFLISGCSPKGFDKVFGVE